MSIAVRLRFVTWRPCLVTCAPTSHYTYRTLAPKLWGTTVAGGNHKSLEFPNFTSSNYVVSSNVRTYPTESIGEEDKFKLVYQAPLKGAVRAIKVFSLCTATAAMIGGPLLVWMGNPSVPLVGRIAVSTLVMLVGVSTTAILHWLLKGYVMKMEYNKKTEKAIAHVMSVTARIRKHEFLLTETRPPPQASIFSTFQVKGRQYFVHTEVIKDRQLLSKLQGPL